MGSCGAGRLNGAMLPQSAPAFPGDHASFVALESAGTGLDHARQGLALLGSSFLLAKFDGSFSAGPRPFRACRVFGSLAQLVAPVLAEIESHATGGVCAFTPPLYEHEDTMARDLQQIIEACEKTVRHGRSCVDLVPVLHAM